MPSMIQRVALLLLVSVCATSCDKLPRVEVLKVVSVPTMTPPMIKEEPEYQPLKLPLEMVVTMGKENLEENDPPGFRWYVEVCEAYEVSHEEGFENPEEVMTRYGLSREDACNFAVFGLTTQQRLSREAELARWAGYTEKLREQLRAYRQQLIDRYEIVRKWGEGIRSQLDNSGE